jgi:hypothetical protein
MTTVTSNQLQIESIKNQVTAEYQEHLTHLLHIFIDYSNVCHYNYSYL